MTKASNTVQELASILQMTITPSSIQQLNHAEAEIETFLSFPNESILSAYEILTTSTDDDQGTQLVKKAAAVFIKRLIEKIKMRNFLSHEDLLYVLEILIKAILNENTSIQIKNILLDNLEIVFSLDTDFEGRKNVLSVISNKMASYESMMILLSLVNTSNNNEIWEIFQMFKHVFIEIGVNIENSICDWIKDFNENGIEDYALGCKSLNYMKLWTDLFYNFVKNLIKKETKDHFEIPALIRIFSQTMSMVLNRPAQIKNCLISISGNEEIDNLMNEIKSNTLKIMVKMITATFENTAEEEFDILSNNQFSNFLIIEGPNIICQGLIAFCTSLNSHEEFNQLTQNDSIHGCLVFSLRYLTKVLKFNKNQNIDQMFFDHMKILIVEVCILLMTTTEIELELYKNEPQQFFLLGIQINDKVKKVKMLKPQAALLLQTLCEKVHGARTYAVNALYKLIEYSIHQRDPEDIPKFYKKIQAHKDSFLINKIVPEVRVETCLMGFVVLRSQIKDIRELDKRFKKLLMKYADFFIHYSEDIESKYKGLIRSRVCLLLAYYFEILFVDRNYDIFTKLYLKFLFENMTEKIEGVQGLQVQATESVLILFQDPDLVERFSDFISSPKINIFNMVTEYIPKANLEKFFDIIYEILTRYEDLFCPEKEKCQGLLRALTLRFESELKNQNAESRVFISKIWNIYLAIAERKSYVENYLEDMESCLVFLFTEENSAKFLEFEEELIKWMNAIIKVNQGPTCFIWKIFGLFPKLLSQNNFVMSNHMLETINLLLKAKDQSICSEKNNMREIRMMALAALNSSSEIASELDRTNGAILLQLIIQNSKLISKEELMIILENIMQNFSNAENKQFKAKLAGVLMISLLRDYDAVIDLIVRQGAFEFSFRMMIEDPSIYESDPYDRKLFITFVSELIYKNNLKQEIIQIYPKIFEAALIILGYSKQNLMKNNIVDGNFTTEYNTEENSKEIFFILSEINEIDEFEIFRNFYKSLKMKNEDLIRSWIEQISENYRKDLKEVVSFKKIESNSEYRKIVKLKM